MSQEKTLDNTQAIREDIKELEKSQDNNNNKNKNTSHTDTHHPKKSSTKKRSNTSNKSKSQKDTSYDDVSDHSMGHQATIPKGSAPPRIVSLQNIQSKLSDPKLRYDFTANIVDTITSFSRSKPTKEELQTLGDIVDRNLIQSIFRVKKL